MLKNEYKEKAYTDELTAIYNRTYFNKELKKEISRYKRDNIPFCFIIIDIDSFKKVNDTFGHQVGDEILKDMTSIIRKRIRITDTFARWGGEEYVELLPNTTFENARLIAENIRTMIEDYTFSNSLKVTCSFGISQIREDDLEESLIKRADEALYRAKAKGKNRVEGQE